MIRRPPRSTQSRSSAASDVYKRQGPAWPGGHDAVWPSSPIPRCTTSRRSGSNVPYWRAARRRSEPVTGISRTRHGSAASWLALRRSSPSGARRAPWRCGVDRREVRGLQAAIVAYTLWGLLTIYWKQLTGLDALELIGWRVATAAAVMAAIVTALGRWPAVVG